MTTANGRTADHDIDPVFLERWSPRALTGEPISDADLSRLFEAARWAPSSFNSQPWRFIYAKRDTPEWPALFELLNPFNQSWASRASALVVLVSKTTLLPTGSATEIPSHSHSLDAGAAWGYLALQAARLGWTAHAMVGFDIGKAATTLNVPADHRVEVAIAIGRKADKSILPDALQAREQPNGRNATDTFVFKGRFPS